MSKHEHTQRVLIVDDSAEVRADLRLLLEIAGDVQVVGESADGREALAEAISLNPDVVVMDLAMPVLDGLAAAALMKAGHAGCRLVALTVHSSDAARQMARAAGFDAFVVKGAPLQELLGAISSRRNPQPDQEPATALSHTASSETGGVS